MKFNVKTILQYLVFFGLAIALLTWVIKDIDVAELWQKIKSANLFFIISVGVVGILSIISRAIRWQILIEPIEKKPGFLNTLFSIFIGYGVNFVTPRLGEVARCAVLAKYENVSADKLAGTMIAERLFDMLSLLIVAVLTFIISYKELNQYVGGKLLLIQEKVGPNAVYIVLAMAIIGFVGLWLLNKKLSKGGSPISKLFANIKEGVLSVFKLKRGPEFIFHSIFIWTCYLGMTYLGFKALDATAHLDIKAGFNVLSLGSLGFIATPGGTGAYQVVVKEVLTSIHQIDELNASAYGMLSWALQNGILIIGALLALVLFPIINKVK
jgi:glycosyltransferase 2 family protein